MKTGVGSSKKKVFTLLRGGSAASLKDCYLLRFDGGAVPNPGTCGSAAVIWAPDGTKLWEIGRYIEYGTNNLAEYTGLEIGLALCLREGYINLKIEGDSNLVINQILGQWQVKSTGLQQHHARVMGLLSRLNYVVVRHVYREFNVDADALTNELQETRFSFERRLA
jgi:ribonuclease HI